MRLDLHRGRLVVVASLWSAVAAASGPPPCSRPACRTQIGAMCGAPGGQEWADCASAVIAACQAGQLSCVAPTSTTTSPSSTTLSPPSSTTTTVSRPTTTTGFAGTTTTVRPGTTTTLPGVTTTTVSHPTTTTTEGPRLSFTTTVGTTSCGSAGYSGTPPAPPLSGELDSDTACTTKIVDVGLGCLSFGGGNATIVPPGRIPDGETSFFAVTGSSTLGPSAGTGPADCTRGAGPGFHCVNNNSMPACGSDGECGGTSGACALDANCFYGPPLPIMSPPPFGSITTCVVNVVQTDAGGTFDAGTGELNLSVPLSSRVYITGNTASPCPKCLSGVCDPTWKTATATTSPDAGRSCAAVGSVMTSDDCRPNLAAFQAPLAVDLTPLTTGAVSKTATDGLFCPGQQNAGAFGQLTARCVAETGVPAGDIASGAAENANLAAVFCVPATGNAALDAVGDLPGPGAIGLNGLAQLHMPGETTTTTIPTTTTTSLPAVTTTTVGVPTTTTTAGPRLSFTTTVGTTSCGPAGLVSAPASPLSGELDSDTACTTKIVDLGLGCLYFGGGNATIVPPGRVPDGETSFFDITGSTTLGPSAGTGPADCTRGAGPGRHCVNDNAMPACGNDAGCGGTVGACALDANCFYGPPLPILSPPPFGSITTCVVNVVQTDAGGTFDAGTGEASLSVPLSSRVYITGNTASPCPRCLSGSCDPTWKTNTATTSPDAGHACTAVGSLMTSNDCRPNLPAFQAPLAVDLTPLTTGAVSKTAADGLFCPGQQNAGAFGQLTARCVAETGVPAGDITSGAAENANLAAVFCVPATGNAAVDGVADLPGPGAIGLNGLAQLHMPGETTTTTIPTTTTTSLPPVTTTTVSLPTTTTTAGPRLSFTTTVGTTSCGSAGYSTTPAAPPLSGEVDSDTACTTKIVDVGLGCLSFGGGNATIVPPAKIPDGATSFFDVTGSTTLGPSGGTGPADCTLGAGPATHCVNMNSMPACTSDTNCGGTAGACALDANCFFGPPLPVVNPPPFGSITTCLVNVVQTDAGGTFAAGSGDVSVSVPLSSRVYITGNTASPCPRCLSGSCDPTWKTNTATTSPDAGHACAAVGSLQTSTDCRPNLAAFQAPLPIDLAPLTTGAVSKTAADGFFCPGQMNGNAGAFGQPAARCIAESGMPAGDITGGTPANANLAAVFCVPPTGNAALDAVADLPGPGAIGLNGLVQLE